MQQKFKLTVIYSKVISVANDKKLQLISHIAIFFDSSAWITKHCSQYGLSGDQALLQTSKRDL